MMMIWSTDKLYSRESSDTRHEMRCYGATKQTLRDHTDSCLQLCSAFWGFVDDVRKVTVHLPPTATHFLDECTLPSRALLLAVQMHLMKSVEMKWREEENMRIRCN